MRVLLQVLTALALIAYPVAVYLGLNYLPAGTIALVLCLLLVVRLMLQKQKVKTLVLPLLVGIALTAGSFVAKRSDWLLYYPVVINLTMLALFSYSLYQGPSMIERLARLKEPDLPDEAIGYLKKSPALVWLIYPKRYCGGLYRRVYQPSNLDLV